MARPKINLSSDVPKSEEVKEEQSVESIPVKEESVVNVQIEYTHEALGMFKNKFDPKTNTVRPTIEEVAIASDKILAFERLKVETIQRGIY